MTVRAPKCRLHKGSGQALVRIGGQGIYRGKHGTEEAKQHYRRFVADRLGGRTRRRFAGCATEDETASVT